MEIELEGATVYLTDGRFETLESVKANALASCEYGAGINYATQGFVPRAYYSIISDGQLVYSQAITGEIAAGDTISFPHTRLTLGN